MKAFRFRLDVVLKLRRREEDRRAQVLAVALRRATALQEALRSIEDRLDEATRAPGPSLGVVNVRRWEIQRVFIERLEGVRRRRQEELGEAVREAARCREDFRRAVRDRRMLDRLKEWRRQNHREAVRRLDTAFMDFAALRADSTPFLGEGFAAPRGSGVRPGSRQCTEPGSILPRPGLGDSGGFR